MTSYYISPLGSGTKDGSSAANAATLSQLPSAVQKVGAGGTILMLADKGSYSLTNPLILGAGGTASAPITIKGIDSHGNAMDAQFVGTRTQSVSSGTADGQDAFRLMNGASNLTFENLSFKDVANAFRVGADISNLSISHASAQNIGHFLEDYASGANKTATISGLVVDDVTVSGYSKSVVRLQYDTHNVVIKNTLGDSKGIDGGYAVGVELDGTVHDVLLSHVTMQNNVYTGTGYWNGDGFATEEGVYNVRFDHTVASGNADAGYDIKSASTVLDGAVADGNNRNFRFWNDDTILMNSNGSDPYHSGGTSSEAQIWLGDNAAVTVMNSSFFGSNAGTAVFNLDQSHATLTLENVTVGMDDGAKLSKLFGGSVINGTPILGHVSFDTAPLPETTPPPAPILVPATGFEAGTLEKSQPGSAGGQVYALYDGLLGRAPDALGLEVWAAKLKAGATTHDIAVAFLASPEGQVRAGAADNATFVEQLYQANLHRASDAGGKAAWVNALDHGTSRADVALGFALSNEHIANLKSVFDAGIFVPDQDSSNVARLYYGVLDRAPDANGLEAWTNAVKVGMSLHDLASVYLGSAEYELANTGLTDAQFVKTMYTQLLGRPGEAAGLQTWSDYLDHAGVRSVVVNGFTDSMEFQSKYAGQSSGAYVEAVYEHVLGRQGDSNGLQLWTSNLDAHAMSRTDVAHVFSASVEFQTKYVAPSDAGFVDSLYENALGRHADAGGLQIWTNAMAHGASRADVAVDIVQSPEAQQHLVGQIEAGWHLV